MPHSGGRVGKGIYFASENGKSACYGNTQFRLICYFCFILVTANTVSEINSLPPDLPPSSQDSLIPAGQCASDSSFADHSKRSLNLFIYLLT